MEYNRIVWDFVTVFVAELRSIMNEYQLFLQGRVFVVLITPLSHVYLLKAAMICSCVALQNETKHTSTSHNFTNKK